MNNQAAQTMPERTYMTRDEALKIARACAYAKCHTHGYLPRTAQEAADWQPHEWALDAIRWNALSQPAGVADGWLRVCDEEMVGAHIGVADASDDYATAKKKLHDLITWHIQVSTDPAVNGGFVLIPREPTPEMWKAGKSASVEAEAVYMQDRPQSVWDKFGFRKNRVKHIYNAMLAAAPAASGGESWRCFYCDEVFTDRESAHLHFGAGGIFNHKEPACQIDIAAYRTMEETVRRYQEDDADIHRAMHRMAGEHALALRREEEKGYARGLRDAENEASPLSGASVSERARALLAAKYRNHGWYEDAGRLCMGGDPTSFVEDDALRVIDRLIEQGDEDDHVITELGRLLAAIAVILKGPEPAGTAWSYHELPELVASALSEPRQVAAEMKAWAHTKMAEQQSSRRDRMMVSEWAKRLLPESSFPVKDFDVEWMSITKEAAREAVKRVALEQALTQQLALSSPRQEVGSTAASTQGLRELVQRWRGVIEGAEAMGYSEQEADVMRLMADELESRLTSPTTGADGGGE